jgi:hypothetical protein
VVDKKIEQNMSVAKMRIFRWMNETKRQNRIRNEYTRSSIGIAAIVDKMKENRLI